MVVYRNPVLTKIEQERREEDRRVKRIFLFFVTLITLACAWVFAQVLAGLVLG